MLFFNYLIIFHEINIPDECEERLATDEESVLETLFAVVEFVQLRPELLEVHCERQSSIYKIDNYSKSY